MNTRKSGNQIQYGMMYKEAEDGIEQIWVHWQARVDRPEGLLCVGDQTP